MPVTYPTLEAWLSALHRNEVGPAPKEDFGAYLLTEPAAQEAFWRRAAAIRRQWPLVCRTCQREFRTERAKGVQCPACRRGGRAKGGH